VNVIRPSPSHVPAIGSKAMQFIRATGAKPYYKLHVKD
jgi:hypothetical protein